MTDDIAGTLISRDLYDGIRLAIASDVAEIKDLISPLEEAGVLVERSLSQVPADYVRYSPSEGSAVSGPMTFDRPPACTTARSRCAQRLLLRIHPRRLSALVRGTQAILRRMRGARVSRRLAAIPQAGTRPSHLIYLAPIELSWSRLLR